MAKHRTETPFANEVRRLLAEQGISTRNLAAQVGVNPGFMVRVLQGAKPPSHKVVAGVSKAFGLPDDYFVEARRETVSEMLSGSTLLLDEVYDHLDPEADTPARGMSSGRTLEPWPSPLSILRTKDATDPSLSRLGAAVLLRYREDRDFREAVDETLPQMEKLAPWPTVHGRKRKTSQRKG